jgi:hypothetical protein
MSRTQNTKNRISEVLDSLIGIKITPLLCDQISYLLIQAGLQVEWVKLVTDSLTDSMNGVEIKLISDPVVYVLGFQIP